MKDTIAFKKECPATHATPTHVFNRRELEQLLAENRAIEVFCSSCAQVHILDADERRRISAKLAEPE